MKAERVMIVVVAIVLAGVAGAGLVALIPGAAGYSLGVVLAGFVAGSIAAGVLRGRGDGKRRSPAA